ncbi:helix-turn-helix domain-containing protein [Candidatus Bipolaricaulota bacterium]|nr:helix-turn-helix domain-containing protein [Candidatus Bipolaricaulota bacterium]
MKEIQESLGKRLNTLRLEKGLTLKMLAQKIHKSESYLSRLEHGQISPSLSTLKVIADVLERPLVHLLEDSFPPLDVQIKKGKHRLLTVSPKLKYEIFSVSNNQLSMFRMTLKKGASSGKEAYSHLGIEAGVLLQGRIKIWVGSKVFLLSAGDSITYQSEKPHRFQNVGEEDAIGIWVVSPPTF